jgi:hypothetical protein
MIRNNKIAFCQNEVKVMVDAYLEPLKVRSQSVKQCIYLLCLNLPYEFIENETGVKQSHIRKIKSYHKTFIQKQQNALSALYEQLGLE